MQCHMQSPSYNTGFYTPLFSYLNHNTLTVNINRHSCTLAYVSRLKWKNSHAVYMLAWDSCSCLTGVETDVVFNSCSSSTSRFDMLRVPRCFSAHNICKECLFELLKSSWQLRPTGCCSLQTLHSQDDFFL